jgi:hypothetical protein
MTSYQTFNPAEITHDLEQRHRDAMLDLVLAWGSLDGALGMLLASVQGKPLEVVPSCWTGWQRI